MSESSTVGLIFTGLGAISLAIGVFLIMRRRAFLRQATATQGTVVQITAGSGSEGGTVYTRTVMFKTAAGLPVTFTESSSWGHVRQSVGDPIPVRYQADNPEKAIIATWVGTWMLPLFPILLGAGFLLPGVLLYVSSGDAAPASVSSPTSTPTAFEPPASGPTTTAPGGTILSVRDPSDSGTAAATCEGVTERGNEREFGLLLDTGDTVILTTRPDNGPGVYHAGSTLAVSGTFFEGATEPFSGVIIVESSGLDGSINVTSGAYGVSGAWDCTAA